MVGLLVGTVLTLAQVTAGTVAGGTRTEVADPMAIEVSLGADVDPKGQAREPFDRQPLGKARAYPETDRYVCDQARVRMLTVKKIAESPTEVAIEASLTLVSEWPLQDIDLTVALIDSQGKEVGHRFWNNLTLGAWSRSYVPPKAEFKIPVTRWTELFANGSAPKLRITVDIQE
ncbi:MAG: hypothetical protein ABJC13_18190 [Acidobacteriota bacterium]